MNTASLLTRSLALLALSSLLACAPVTQSTAPRATSQTTVDAVGVIRDRQPPPDAQRFSIVSANSTLTVLAFRDGPMARLGHNHVITSNALSGSVWLAEPIVDSLVRLVLPVDSLIVDDPAARAAEGAAFAAELDDKARTGTRGNMLGDRLLNAAQHAFVRMTCATDDTKILTQAGSITCDVDIAGMTLSFAMPLTLHVDGNRLHAEGEATVTHEQLGLTPFSAAGGAITVAEGLTLRYSIVAQRLSN